MAEAVLYQEGESLDFTPSAAITAGDVVQLPDGRAAFAPVGISASAKGAVSTCGIVKCTKTASIALLKGGDAYWDVSAGKVHFRPENGTNDFYMGTVAADAAAADTYCYVSLNTRASYQIDLGKPDGQYGWTTSETNGLGVRQATAAAIPLPNVWTLAMDNTSEAAMAQLTSDRTVLVSSKPILECKVAIYDLSASATDLDIGLATGGHATDFESVTNFAAFHFDGGDNNIDTHSDDNSTDRAPADSTIDWVDDTDVELWIDARDDTNVLYYVDGVLVDTSSSKRILTNALTSAVKAVAEVEKTSSTDIAEVRVKKLRVRTQSE